MINYFLYFIDMWAQVIHFLSAYSKNIVQLLT